MFLLIMLIGLFKFFIYFFHVSIAFLNNFIYNTDRENEVIILAVAEQIKILCVKLNISVSELARLCNTSPQAFSQKMKRGGFTPADLKKVAEAAGCKYEGSFILPDGGKVTD